MLASYFENRLHVLFILISLSVLHPNFFLQILPKNYAGVWGHGFHDLCSPSAIETRHKITMHSCLREDAGNVQICTHDEGRNQIAISDPSNSEKLFTCSLKN